MKTQQMPRQNYFQLHGSTIWDDRRKVLEAAQFDGYKINKYEKLTNGEYLKETFNTSSTFFHDGRLYMFLTSHAGQIDRYFELNTSKEECESGTCGCYYEVKKATE